MQPNADLNAARKYLRSKDKIGGYLPLLAMAPDAGERWTYLWSDIRNLDERSEGKSGLGSTISPLGEQELHKDPRLAAELEDLARWPMVEASLYKHGEVKRVSDYFKLMYYRAFCPVYICGVIGLPGEPRAALETFAMYVGYGAQLMDDTLDLVEDITQGRIFVTDEELNFLGLTPDDLRTQRGLDKVSRFRNKWALYYYLLGYGATSLFMPANRRTARSWLEFGLRALLDGKILPLPLNITRNHRRYCNHFGIYMAFLDFPFPSEALRYKFFHRFMKHMVRRVSIVDISKLQAKYDQDDTPLPEQFRVRQLYERHWHALDLPEAVPEDRHRVSFVHYGLKGVLPTLLDLTRILFLHER